MTSSCLSKVSLYSYADDNTISTSANNIDDLIEILKDDTQKTIDLMKLNQMIVNPKKCQAMFISKKRNTLPGSFKLQINNSEIAPQSAGSHNR